MPGWNLQDYEPVEDRIAKFYADHPLGRITTEMVHVGADGYIVKASAWRDGPFATDAIDVGGSTVPGGRRYVVMDLPPDATGYAQEAVTDKGVNSTSALENCETSAIGRALANLGYAAKGKRPSREEMSKASSEAAGSSDPKTRAASPSGTTVPPVAGRTEDGPGISTEEAARPAASEAAAPDQGEGALREGQVPEAGEGASSPITLPIDEPNAKALEIQVERLLTTVGGNRSKALIRLNRNAGRTFGTWKNATEEATRAEVAAAISDSPLELPA